MGNNNVERNKQMVQRFLQFINTGDKDIAEEIISPDVIFYAPTSPEPMHGLKGYMDVLEMMRGAMPDVKWTIEEVIAEGNKMFIRFNMSGTQTEPFMGMPAANKPVISQQKTRLLPQTMWGWYLATRNLIRKRRQAGLLQKQRKLTLQSSTNCLLHLSAR